MENTQPTPFPNGTQIRDLLNDGLILTIQGHEKRDDGSILYYAADPSCHVPDWILTHEDILTDEYYSGKRWTVLA